MGGGITPRGTERGIKISRRDGDGSVQQDRRRPHRLVQADDVIYVQREPVLRPRNARPTHRRKLMNFHQFLLALRGRLWVFLVAAGRDRRSRPSS